MDFSMSEMIAAQGMTPGTSEVNIAINPVDDIPSEAADCLGLAPGEEVMCLERVRTADGRPFAYVISHIVADLEGLSFNEAHYQGSLYEFLQSHCSIFISDVDAAIEACIAEGRLCDKLEVPAGSPLLVLHQCHRDLSGRPIVASLDYIVQNSLRVNIKRQRSGHLFLMEE
jgi:GntR family transcriptional regulator